jgi:hypothetical protein
MQVTDDKMFMYIEDIAHRKAFEDALRATA